MGGKIAPLSLVHTIATPHWRRAERILHVAFWPERVRGEWFRLTGSDVETVKGIGPVQSDLDWPSAIRDRLAVPVVQANPRKPVQFPVDWLQVARRRAVAERPVPLVYYLIELIKKDAEAAGETDLPPVPWALKES